MGGLGFAASANIGRDVGVFEPTHGSAPKYAELDPPIVNPIAMILCAAMMLDWLGDTERADVIRKAVADVISEGAVRTYDMLKLRGGPAASIRARSTTICDDRRDHRKAGDLRRPKKRFEAEVPVRCVSLQCAGAMWSSSSRGGVGEAVHKGVDRESRLS